MKKVIFSAITALLLVSVAFGQKTDTRIYNIIQVSKEHNAQYNGVYDPNKIWPGQILHFFFEDGTTYQITVEPGDTESDIIREIIELENEHGPVINPDTVSKSVSPVPITEPIHLHWWDDVSILGLLLALFCALVIFIKLMHIRYKNRRRNPVTAGTPQVPGGVNDANAHNRMQEVASNRYPGAQIQIKNIRRGWLSGLAKVFYADGKSKKLHLKDVAAYAAKATINGREETIYFLQGCGNDARQGNYMTGDLEFRPYVAINQDGSESPLPVETIEETVIENTPTATEPKQAPVNLGSETHQQRMKALSIIEAEVAKGDVHEVILDINPDNFGVNIKYKFLPAKKAEKKEDKK